MLRLPEKASDPAPTSQLHYTLQARLAETIVVRASALVARASHGHALHDSCAFITASSSSSLSLNGSVRQPGVDTWYDYWPRAAASRCIRPPPQDADLLQRLDARRRRVLRRRKWTANWRDSSTLLVYRLWVILSSIHGSILSAAWFGVTSDTENETT